MSWIWNLIVSLFLLVSSSMVSSSVMMVVMNIIGLYMSWCGLSLVKVLW